MTHRVWASGLLGLAACSFPDVDLGAGGDAAASASSGITSTASDSGSVASGQGSTSLTSSSTGVADCDVDGDGYAIEAPGCCTAGADPACDCDDDDDQVNPGVVGYSATARKNVKTGPLAYDFDCSGASELEYPIGACGVCSASADAEVFDPDAGQPDACGATGKRRYCTAIDACQQDVSYTTLACH